MIRVLVVDDHPVVSEGLANRYAAAPDLELVGTAASVSEALYLVASRAVDVVLADVQLDVLLTPRHVAALAERCRVVLFSARAGDPYIQQLLAAGAHAVVDKAAPLQVVDTVLREVHAGRASPEVTHASGAGARQVLSAREHEVYCQLARCQTPKEVAASLGIARSTVYCHIESIRRKLGVQTLQEIVARVGGEVAEPAPRSGS
ncbi:MAG: response regulator transcription factor [Myxococcota bacterium]